MYVCGRYLKSFSNLPIETFESKLVFERGNNLLNVSLQVPHGTLLHTFSLFASVQAGASSLHPINNNQENQMSCDSNSNNF